ncbi:hypothetical protein CI105_00790 [Candidatus Izimaplasma bacterium ZiA1]|uniref:ion channel n=1 Tax=Candidatus Izimoplasma sp. ZiA1 TaxID=2024899 RepID=UPI000BAA46E4|nr:hypothetical protein CI105_00790 [Candidatus Izimaplasma bacterium ZiA1]
MKRGIGFYLIFSMIFFTASMFYINNTLYNNSDYLASALFAFASLFTVFVLLLFNVHMIIINFFRLPIKYLIADMKTEFIKKGRGKNKKRNKFSYTNYQATITLVFYSILSILIIGAIVRNGLLNNSLPLIIVTQSVMSFGGFLVLISSWQYLFKILPKVLNKNIDAKNGFILTLSVTVMIIYLVFIIFEVNRFDEIMIFVLIIGFIALLGVNINLIIGEINIFQNLKENSHSSKVTKAVFMIFFSFHLYVILYASVIAFSIYGWNHEAYIFSNDECYVEVIPENPAEQPYYTSQCPHEYGDFLYYTVVTVSTLGYGDISPNTEFPISQAWSGFLSIYGFTFFALSIGYVSNIAHEGFSNGKDEQDD